MASCGGRACCCEAEEDDRAAGEEDETEGGVGRVGDAAEEADMGGWGRREEEAVGDTAEGVGCGGGLLGWADASRDLRTKENALDGGEGEEEARSPATVAQALYRRQELRALRVQLLYQLAFKERESAR
jgi:hypothetical protein